MADREPAARTAVRKAPYRQSPIRKGAAPKSPIRGRAPVPHPAAPRKRKVAAAATPRPQHPVSALDPSRPRALQAVWAALEKKAENPTVLDVRGISSYADYVVLLSAESARQIEAIGQSIEDRLRKEDGVRPIGVEGAGESGWMLIDFGDVVIHIFYRDARHFYDLEGLWADAPRVTVAPEALALQPSPVGREGRLPTAT